MNSKAFTVLDLRMKSTKNRRQFIRGLVRRGIAKPVLRNEKRAYVRHSRGYLLALYEMV